MIKKLSIVLLSIILMLSMVGCGNEVEEIEDTEVDATIDEDVESIEKLEDIDWDKAVEEIKEELTDQEYFNYVKDISIKVDEEEKRITFTAVLDDSTSKDVAVDFADTIIRRFSSSISIQKDDIKAPGHEYLGEVFDHYAISIGIAPFSKIDNDKEWYVFDAIAKGRHRNPKPKK